MKIGTKIRRLRELKGIKQEVLAISLGVTRQAISKIEQSEKVDDSTLEKISTLFNIPIDAIKQFNEELVISFISNDMCQTNSISYVHPKTMFNLIEMVVELNEENRRLNKILLEIETCKP